MSHSAQAIGNTVPAPQFVLMQKRISNPHQIQFYANYGMTELGPWARIGLNDMEYTIGFAPAKPKRRPSQEQKFKVVGQP